MSISNHIARQLLEVKAVRLNPSDPFTWASGMLSPIYCDNRVTLSHPEARSVVKKALVEAAAAFEPFDVVAGVATAGIPYGALLADALAKPFVYVRSSAKDHGRRNQIEGSIQAGARVLLIEDLISTGGSSILAAEALNSVEMPVIGVLAVFQYGFQKADTAFAAKNIPFRTLTHYDALIDEAVRSGYITEAEVDTLKRWRENPEAWGALYAS